MNQKYIQKKIKYTIIMLSAIFCTFLQSLHQYTKEFSPLRKHLMIFPTFFKNIKTTKDLVYLVVK